MVKTNNFLAIFFNAKFLNSFFGIFISFPQYYIGILVIIFVWECKKNEIGFLQLIYRPNCGFTLLPTACRLPTANFGQLPIADGIQKTRQNGMYNRKSTFIIKLKCGKKLHFGRTMHFLPQRLKSMFFL